MKSAISDLVGWYGMVAIISAYGLLNFGMLAVSDIIYCLLNITGAASLAYISFKKSVYPSVVLNSIWLIIGVVALVNVVA